jgi:hypothetical protein
MGDAYQRDNNAKTQAIGPAKRPEFLKIHLAWKPNLVDQGILVFS